MILISLSLGDALGWGPVGSSTLFAANAVFILIAILLTFRLSAAGMSDESLLIVGSIFSCIGYSLMYFLWAHGTTVFLFALPIVFGSQAFPFSGAPTRSIFTRVVGGKPMLRKFQGSMQAMLSMTASVAGFVAPSLISQFVLRTPEEVRNSSDKRELTSWALYAPFFSLLTLLGVLYLKYSSKMALTETEVEEAASLLEREEEPEELFQPNTLARRRDTISLMGIPQFAYPDRELDMVRRHSTGLVGLGSSMAQMQEEKSRRKTTIF